MREREPHPDFPDPRDHDDAALDARIRAAAARETVPAHLVACIERRLEAEQRRRWAATTALAAAAVVIVAVTVRLLAPPASPGPVPGGTDTARAPDRPIRAVVEPGPGLLAHRVDTKTAGVTVVFLYPTVEAGVGVEPTSRPVETERNET